MRISIRFEDNVAIMSLDGKFLAGADGPFLRQKVKDLIEAGTRHLVIDFTEVPYIDSTGLGFLAGTREVAEASNVALTLASLNEHVMKVLDSVKLSPFFVIDKNVPSALARVKEIARAGAGAALPKAPRIKKQRAAQGEEPGDSETVAGHE